MVTRERLPATSALIPGPEEATETRDELILKHLPQVKLIARQINDRLPVSVGINDLISAGTIGLIAAIDRYDPSQRVKLRTFAEYKIRGAILDSLRTMDWAPRQQRRRGRLMDSAIASLEQKLHRKPTASEVAEELSMPVERYQEWLSNNFSLTLGSLDARGVEEQGRCLLHHLADQNGSSPSELLERSELEKMLAEAIEGLPSLEKTILSLYYYEEMTLREIARIVDLHESRISQLKSQAIQRLRSIMAKGVSLPDPTSVRDSR